MDLAKGGGPGLRAGTARFYRHQGHPRWCSRPALLIELCAYTGRGSAAAFLLGIARVFASLARLHLWA